MELATNEKYEQMVGETPPAATEMFVVKADEELGIIGLGKMKNGLFLFSYIKPEIQRRLKDYRREVIRAYSHMVCIMDDQDLPVYSRADDVDGADRLLEHIGFEPYQKGYYKWHG